MIERKVYGPMEFLAPITDLKTELEVSGVKTPGSAYTTHVFLDDVTGDDIDAMIGTFNYAGSFSVPKDLTSTKNDRAMVRIDITEALKRAIHEMPNFYITFITLHERKADTQKLFDFETVHIQPHVPEHTDLDLSADVTCGLVTGHKNPL